MCNTKQNRLEVITFTKLENQFSLEFCITTIYCFEYKLLPLNRIRIRTMFSLN